MAEINAMSEKREVVSILFRHDRDLSIPIPLHEFISEGALSAAPQSITSLRAEGHEWIRTRIREEPTSRSTRSGRMRSSKGARLLNSAGRLRLVTFHMPLSMPRSQWAKLWVTSLSYPSRVAHRPVCGPVLVIEEVSAADYFGPTSDLPRLATHLKHPPPCSPSNHAPSMEKLPWRKGAPRSWAAGAGSIATAWSPTGRRGNDRAPVTHWTSTIR